MTKESWRGDKNLPEVYPEANSGPDLVFNHDGQLFAPVAADVPVAAGQTRRMFYFLRMLYRICNPILLSIRIFNPPTLTLLQVFYCDADCKSLY